MYKRGAFSDMDIKNIIDLNYIIDAKTSNINPASLDLNVSNERYRIDSIFMPKSNETVRSMLGVLGAREHKVDDILERNVIYLFKINESFKLSDNIFATCNPKSSSGRHDLHVRIVVDCAGRYDTIPENYKGEAWVIIVPRSYPVIMPENFSITQIKFNTELGYFNEAELKNEWDTKPILYHRDSREYRLESIKMRDGDGSVIMTVDLSFDDIVGYESTLTNSVLDLGGPNSSINYNDFFKPIYKVNNSLKLRKDNFYILSTKQYLRLAPHFTSEMIDMDSRVGEFRSHYAGFFDPGWGCNADESGHGRPITLEVRPYEDIVVQDGQPIGRIKFEYMSQIPERHYDMMNSNYLYQSGPKLAKQFKM